ncbi:MAG TPA: hypothetical protein VGI55_00975 [Solirubrobacteraceae bacterium]|jgi:hypothetical protein
MRLKPIKRAARRRAVAEAAVAAYSQWREECAAVRSTYRRWASASAVDEPLAFIAYKAALDREQRAATLYARLIRRAGHVVEIGLAQVQTSSGTR